MSKPLYCFALYICSKYKIVMQRILVCFLLLCTSIKVGAIEALVAHDLFYTSAPSQPNNLVPSAETYWQINPRTLHYTTTPEKTIIVRVKIYFVFRNDSGIIKEDQYILQTTPKTTLKELANNKIIDLRRYNISFGFVRMKLVMTDMADSTNKFTF